MSFSKEYFPRRVPAAERNSWVTLNRIYLNMTQNYQKWQEFRKGVIFRKKKVPAATSHIHGEDLGLYLYVYYIIYHIIYIYIHIYIYIYLYVYIYIYTYILYLSFAPQCSLAQLRYSWFPRIAVARGSVSSLD